MFSGEVISTQMSKKNDTHHKIHIYGNEPQGIVKKILESKQFINKELSQESNLQLNEIVHQLQISASSEKVLQQSDLSEKLQKILKQEDLRSILLFYKKLNKYKKFEYRSEIFIESFDQWTVFLGDELKSEVQRSITKLRTDQLNSLQIGHEYTLPFSYSLNSLQPKYKAIGRLIGSTGIYIIFVLLHLSAFYPALNSTAGEKETGTFSILLSTSVHTGSVVYGKFLAVLLSSLTGLCSYILTFWIGGKLITGKMTSSLHQFPNSWIILILAVLSASYLISSLSLCTGFLSKKKSEGQSFLSLCMLFILVPVVLAMSLDLTLSNAYACIPLLNVALLVKCFFSETIPYYWLIITLLSNVIFAHGVLKFSTNLIQSDYAGDVSFTDLLSFDRKLLQEPSPALSVLVSISVLFLSLYLNLILIRKSFFFSLISTQLLAFLLVPISISKFFRLNFKKTFVLKRGNFLSYLAAGILGVSGPFIVLFFYSQQRIPKEIYDEFTKQFQSLKLSPSENFLFLCLLPGVCEELTYRGLILSGFIKRFSNFWSILLTSILFSLNHFSLVQIPSYFFMGCVLGYITIRSKSVIPAIFTHIIYNTIILINSNQNGTVLSGLNPLYGFTLTLVGISLMEILARYQDSASIQTADDFG
jgi:membrane protease YdiL (CAAX protease family)